MSELKPCPFCGGEAETHETIDGWIATCSSEQSELDGFTHKAQAYGTTEAEAIAAWNSRAERTCKPTEEGCCPLCGEDIIKCDVAIGAGGGAVELDPPMYHNYCPHCGAKVVGE